VITFIPHFKKNKTSQKHTLKKGTDKEKHEQQKYFPNKIKIKKTIRIKKNCQIKKIVK